MFSVRDRILQLLYYTISSICVQNEETISSSSMTILSLHHLSFIYSRTHLLRVNIVIKMSLEKKTALRVETFLIKLYHRDASLFSTKVHRANESDLDSRIDRGTEEEKTRTNIYFFH